MNILPISDWRTPVTDIPGQSIGNWHIKKRIVKAGTILGMDVLGYDYCLFIQDTPMTVLREGILENDDTESVWMSDSPMEYYMTWELIGRTKGPNVLIGGLGLGLFAHLLDLRKDIEHITIIEKQAEVIQMIRPYLPLCVEVIGGDFLYEIQTLSTNGKEFDTIVADIWKGYDNKSRELFEDCQYMMDDYYPNGIHLFWAFQGEYDTEQARYAQIYLDRHKEKQNG